MRISQPSPNASEAAAPTPARQAALKPAAAQRYPFLPVRMWTEATRLAAIVSRHRPERSAGDPSPPPRLPQSDFVFRDGRRRS